MTNEISVIQAELNKKNKDARGIALNAPPGLCNEYTKSYGDGSPRNHCRICNKTREEHGLPSIGSK